MANEADKPSTKKSSFLREGFRELGRKLDRRKLRQMTSDDRARNAALHEPGREGLGSRHRLFRFCRVSAQIKSVVARTGELAATTQKLEGERTAQEEQRRGEVARFDARRKVLDDLKRPVDAASANRPRNRARRSAKLKRMESRLAAIAGELAAN